MNFDPPQADALAAVSVLVVLFLILGLIFGAAWFLRGALWAGSEEDSDRETEQVEPNVLALLVAAGAAILGIVSVFLPALESEAFAQIKHNSLIQSGTGFFIIGVSLALLGDSFRIFQNRVRSWGVALGGVLLIGAAVYGATGSRVRLEGHNVLNGQSIFANASPGIGIYAAGAAGLIAVFAGYAIATNRGTLRRGGQDSPATKRCPDCAESVLGAARICKHCGHEFEQREPSSA